MGVRGLLSYRLSVTQCILALGVFVAFLSLIASGDLLAGLGVIVLGVAASSIFVFVQRRRHPARTHRLEEAAMLPNNCEVVWGLIRPAETAPSLDPSLGRGYQVPGTPDGLGERQALERLDGTTVIIEVIDYEPNRRAVTRQISPTIVDGQRGIQTVEPVDGGCMYTIAVEVDLKPGHRISPKWEPMWRSDMHEHLIRVRSLLASTGQSATPAGSPPATPSIDSPPPDPIVDD